MGALAAIVTDSEIVVALIGVGITIIHGADISIVTILGGRLAKSVGAIADIGEAVYVRASYYLRGEAMVARESGIDATSLSNNASGRIAWAIRNTLDGRELATQGGVAGSSVANIWCSASDRREIASRSGQTEILSAKVAISASQRCVGASRSLDTNGTTIDGARISIVT